MTPHPPAGAAASDTKAIRPTGSAAAGELWKWRLIVVGAVLLIFASLQLWRPYFFLTDDNLSGVLPAFADVGNIIRQGKFPWTPEALYGGKYNMWRDPGTISLLFPVHIAAFLLASSSFRLLTMDAICLVHLMVAALAMQACVRALCARFDRELPHWFAAFLALSYVTSNYSLAIGSSWFNFLGNQAATPLVVLGLLAAKRRSGVLLVAAGMLYGMIGGHLAPFLYAAVFLGAFSLCLAGATRTWESAWRYFIGCLVAAALALPALIPAVLGYASSDRAAVLTDNSTIQYSLSVPAMIFGSTLGIESIGSWDFQPELGYLSEIAVPITFSAAALCILAAFGTVTKFRSPEWLLVLMLVLVALFVHRPQWLQQLISHLPMFKALRWPMREAVLFLFFAHLLVALVWWRLPRLVRLTLPPISAAAFFIPLFSQAPPTFNSFPTDRMLLLDGRAERVWREVGVLMPRARECWIVPLLDRDVGEWMGRHFVRLAPHILMGGYNYPSLFGMKSVTGYTMPGFAQPFRGQLPIFGPGYFPAGFSTSDLEDPTLLFTRLHSVDPLIVEYRIGQTKVHAAFREGIEGQPTVTLVP